MLSINVASRKVIIVSNKNCNELNEIKRVRSVLFELGFDWPLCYKTDNAGGEGKYGHKAHLFCRITNWNKLDNYHEIQTNLNKLSCLNERFIDLEEFYEKDILDNKEKILTKSLDNSFISCLGKMKNQRPFKEKEKEKSRKLKIILMMAS